MFLCATLLPPLLLLLSEQRLCCLLVAKSLRAQVQTHIQRQLCSFPCLFKTSPAPSVWSQSCLFVLLSFLSFFLSFFPYMLFYPSFALFSIYHGNGLSLTPPPCSLNHFLLLLPCFLPLFSRLVRVHHHRSKSSPSVCLTFCLSLFPSLTPREKHSTAF